MSAAVEFCTPRKERFVASHRRRSHREPVHLVQMWVVPDEAGITPGLRTARDDGSLLAADLVTIASGMPKHRNDRDHIRNRSAAAWRTLAGGR